MNRLLLAGLLCLNGCALMKQMNGLLGPQHSEWYEQSQKIEILTSSPANIEINNEYIGLSPLTYPIIRGPSDECQDCGGALLIVALPTVPGQHRQFKYISPTSKTPSRVFFEMSLEPSTEKQEITIKNR